MAAEPFDLSTTFVHLGSGARALPLPGFSWTSDYLRGYLRTFAAERDERRLVGIVSLAETWRHWECHVGGDELVVQLSGRSAIVQEVNGEHHTIELGPGQALINPRGTWHTSDVYEPGQSLFVAAGRQTKYRPRDLAPTPAAEFAGHDRP
ncbi:cupin domain-containing protein [Solihabitans fulvus]|uniref:Cupin domain-containing protein n=1 Tax=Solihabitans fulvus TaxID=1892852 RepID=A0A5B2XPZ2_9PSEU|nr:cupin domain-containing protein [Solihabitans fulvus]KAA2265807.1 cupin domain-containing protein [Solihabitans fulvus]